MRRDPAKAIALLDAMLQFFDGGRLWIRGPVADQGWGLSGRGLAACAPGAAHSRAGTEFYLRAALSMLDPDPPMAALIRLIGRGVLPELCDRDLINFNDEADRYDEVRALIIEARALAQAELKPNPPPMLHQHLVSECPIRGSRRSEKGEVTGSAETPVNIAFVLA
jgi:hypothetical protein